MTPWTVAHQAPLSMGFPKQECWSGLPFPTPGDIPDLQPESPRSPAVAVGFFTTMSPGNQLVIQFSSVQLLSRVRLFVTPWTVAYQAPPSMGFSKQECWSGLPFPSPGDLPDPGIEPGSPALLADALPSEPPGHLYTCRVNF